MKIAEVRNFVDGLSQTEFFEKCLDGVLKTDGVSKLMTSNIGFLSESEKTVIRNALKKIGLPNDGTAFTDEELEDAIRYMSNRAFKLY